MSALNKNMFRLIGLLCVVLALVSLNARAALPDAGTAIGTVAVVDYEVDGEQDRSESNLVTTTVAQVYAIKIETVDGIVGKAGQDVDIRFAVRNIGNGSDDVTLTLSDTAGKIVSFALLDVDGAGMADEGSKTSLNMGDKFSRNAIARDQVRQMAARVAIPKDASGKMKFAIGATNKGKNTKSVNAEVTIRIVDDADFIVEPGKAALLDEKKKTLLEFKVKGGNATSNGHFELFVAKKSDPAALVSYQIKNGKIVFNNSDVAPGKITSEDKKNTFVVDAVAANLNTSFIMGIEIPGAQRGEEYVMYVKYGKDASVELTQSAPVRISFAHVMKAPKLDAIDNSAGGVVTKGSATIPGAIAGETAKYTLKLTNRSTAPEKFSLELADLGPNVREAWLTDEKGVKFGTTSGSGLPETALIAPGASLLVKIEIALAHDAATAQAFDVAKLNVKSITHPQTAAVSTTLRIEKIAAIEKPIVQFFADALGANKTNEIIVSGRDDIAGFYMDVAAPKQIGDALREYEITFNSPDVTFQTIKGGAMGSAAPAMRIRLGHGAKSGMFLVKADLRGKSELTATVSILDVVAGKTSTATIVLKKSVSIGFAESGYSDKGAADLDAVLTVNVMNFGAAIGAGDYRIEMASKDGWKADFSLDGKNWNQALPLPQMKSREKKAIHVKIRVPKGVKSGARESLALSLFKPGTVDATATVFVTLTIDRSKLVLEKTVAIEKAGVAKSAFAKESKLEVEHGDKIFYRVVVANPIDAPDARNVVVKDRLPKHVKFKQITNGATASHADGNVVMDIGDLEAGVSKTLEYSVTVDLAD